MQTAKFQDRTYQIDDDGFLIDPAQWDEDFAEGMAKGVGIPDGLSDAHWQVIHLIRNTFSEYGRCPVPYEICRSLKLRLADLKRLFPSGYLRGACRVAGVTYKEEGYDPNWLPKERLAQIAKPLEGRTYRIDVRGFLIDPTEWDEEYAINRAKDMKMPGGLTPKHWDIIGFLRRWFEEKGKVPTLYEVCEANHIELDELEHLFPDGYHRGAVRISGLRAR